MWLTAEIPPLWHSGYIYTRGGGVAHAVGLFFDYYIWKKLKIYVYAAYNPYFIDVLT